MSLPPSRSRQVRLALLVISVALLVTGVAGLRVVKTVPSAKDVFRLAQEFVAEHHSAHFEGVTTASADDKEDDDTDTSRISGDFDTRIGSHTFSRGSAGVEETLMLDKAVYYRWAETEAELAAERFEKETFDDEEFAMMSGAFEVMGMSPSGSAMTEMLELGVNPVIVSRGEGETVVRVELDAQKLFGLMGKKMKLSMTMTLTVGDAGELRKVHTTGSFMGAKVDSTVTYSTWGKAVTLTEPDASLVDTTPDVAEEDLQAFTAAPLYVPATVPAGWEITWGEVLSAEDSGEDCPQVEIDFDSDDDYLWLYEMPTSCAPAFESDMQPLQVGPYPGAVSTDEDDLTWIQFKVDDRTTIQVDTTLSPAEAVAFMANLKPMTFPLAAGDA